MPPKYKRLINSDYHAKVDVKLDLMDIPHSALVCRALSSETRLQILYTLIERSMTISQLAEYFYLPISSMSGHIHILEEAGIQYDSTPGVSAFCGAASALDMEYTLPGISQSVIITRMAGRTPMPEKESIESFAAHGATMVIFLSTGMLEKLSGRLIEGGYAPETPAAIVYKATWPDEEKYICTVDTLARTAAEHGITKTALIIVGGAVAQSGYERSKLYDPGFTTEFREASE